MAAKQAGENSLVYAVQAVYTALQQLDTEARQRVVTSALSLLGEGVPQVAAVTTPSQALAPREPLLPSRAKSPVELMQEKQPATNSQRIALFAYYRERFEGEPRFSRGDLKPYFGKAKEPPPANYDRDFSAAVRQGWIHEDGADSYLTSKGLEAVEAGFGGRGLPRGRTSVQSGRRRKGSRKKTAKR
jgi:hypothetical protein